jgi:hypothetical protein
MTDPAALAEMIRTLAGDRAQYQQLAEEAVVRPILTWRSYARELLRQLASHRPRPQLAPLPRQWQHLLIDAQLEVAPDIGQLALAALFERRPVDCALIIGKQPEWRTALIGHHLLQAWQLVAGESGDVSSIGQLSRIEAPLHDSLPLLLDELRDNAIRIDLIVLAAAQTTDSDLLHSLKTRLDDQSGDGLLLIEGNDSAKVAEQLGLITQIAIELPGLTGYRYPNVTE